MIRLFLNKSCCISSCCIYRRLKLNLICIPSNNACLFWNKCGLILLLIRVIVIVNGLTFSRVLVETIWILFHHIYIIYAVFTIWVEILGGVLLFTIFFLFLIILISLVIILIKILVFSYVRVQLFLFCIQPNHMNIFMYYIHIIDNLLKSFLIHLVLYLCLCINIL